MIKSIYVLVERQMDSSIIFRGHPLFIGVLLGCLIVFKAHNYHISNQKIDVNYFNQILNHNFNNTTINHI